MIDRIAFIKRLKAECNNIERPFHAPHSTSVCWRALELKTKLCLLFAVSIRVKRAAKPVPVKRRLRTARRFYFTELAVSLVYIFVTSHVLANIC